VLQNGSETNQPMGYVGQNDPEGSTKLYFYPCNEENCNANRFLPAIRAEILFNFVIGAVQGSFTQSALNVIGENVNLPDDCEEGM